MVDGKQLPGTVINFNLHDHRAIAVVRNSYSKYFVHLLVDVSKLCIVMLENLESHYGPNISEVEVKLEKGIPALDSLIRLGTV